MRNHPLIIRLSKTSVLGPKCLIDEPTTGSPDSVTYTNWEFGSFASKEAKGPMSPSSAQICCSVYSFRTRGHRDLMMMVVAVTVTVRTCPQHITAWWHSSKHGTDSDSSPLPPALWNWAGSVLALRGRKTQHRAMKEPTRITKWGVWVWIQSWMHSPAPFCQTWGRICSLPKATRYAD